MEKKHVKHVSFFIWLLLYKKGLMALFYSFKYVVFSFSIFYCDCPSYFLP